MKHFKPTVTSPLEDTELKIHCRSGKARWDFLQAVDWRFKKDPRKRGTENNRD